jgi:hypothetical protein
MENPNLKPLNTDWYGIALQTPPQWGLVLTEDSLIFRGKLSTAPNCIAPDKSGDFVEGLWEADVAELFLLNPKTGYYIEFNLGPKGAWWCCTFESPRVRTNTGPEKLTGVKTTAAFSESAWDSVLKIPLKSLPTRLVFDPETTKGNITFCVGVPQHFVSLADLGDGVPDFHRPDKWIGWMEMLT